jgi:hypothetical protein
MNISFASTITTHWGSPILLQIYQPFRHLAQKFAQEMDQLSQSPNKCSAVAFNSMALLQTSNKPGPVIDWWPTDGIRRWILWNPWVLSQRHLDLLEIARIDSPNGDWTTLNIYIYIYYVYLYTYDVHMAVLLPSRHVPKMPLPKALSTSSSCTS